jgi:hypothetical protein
MGKFYKITIGIFAGFFFLILALTIQVWYNNYQINKGIEATNKEINSVTRLVINDSLAFSDSGKLVILSKTKGQIKIDTLGLTKKYRDINEVNQKLETTKRYVLDANTITYLIQIISFFLIGLQIFIGNKNEKETAVIRKKMKLLSKNVENDYNNLKNKFKNTYFVSNITNCSELVFSFSSRLDLMDNEEKKVRICYLISKNLLSIQEYIKNNEENTFLMAIPAKKYSLELLLEAKEIFLSKKYDTTNGYFNDIYKRLLETIDFIKKIKESEME